MKTGWKAAIVLTVALGAGATGCSGSGSDSTPPATASPSEVLAAAVGKLDAEPLRLTLKTDLADTVISLDRAGRKAHLESTMTFVKPEKREVILLGDEVFTRTGDPAKKPGPWLHLPASRVEPGGSLDILPENDAFGAAVLTKGIVEARQTGEDSYAGVVDFGKVHETGISDVPFTAKVDGQGRLTEFVTDLPSAVSEQHRNTLTYSDFGTPVNVTRPPANEVKEAPEGLTGTIR